MASNLAPSGTVWTDSNWYDTHPKADAIDENESSYWFSENITPPHFIYSEWVTDGSEDVLQGGTATASAGSNPEYAIDGNSGTSWNFPNILRSTNHTS